jgi:hypothetical protein
VSAGARIRAWKLDRVIALAVALAVALASAAGCDGDGPRLAECDSILATVEKVVTCRRLDDGQRGQLRQAARTLGDALDRLAGAGADRAPAELVSEVRRTCALQTAELQRVYEKDAPDCLR